MSKRWKPGTSLLLDRGPGPLKNELARLQRIEAAARAIAAEAVVNEDRPGGAESVVRTELMQALRQALGDGRE